MFRNYLAVALRNLARNRLYVSINVIGLGVGFCAALLIVLYVRFEYSYETVTWNRRRFSFKPTPGTTGPSEIIGVAPDFALDTRRKTLPQILYVDPEMFTTLGVRLMGSRIPEALQAIDAAWRETGNTNIRRRFLNGFAYHVDMPLQLFAASSALAGVIALLTVGAHCWRVARAKPVTALRYE